jgi:hypothetical protein
MNLQAKTIASAVPRANRAAIFKMCVTRQLLSYEPFSKRRKDRLHQTEHPNGMPASDRLSLVNGGKPTAALIRDVPGRTKVEVRLPKRCPVMVAKCLRRGQVDSEKVLADFDLPLSVAPQS